MPGAEPIPYDEFGYFADNAAEFGLPFSPPTVRRDTVELADGRRMSALVWGHAPPSIVLLHGGGQNAHTWDTVALALDRPLVAVDLPGHGHSDAYAPADGVSRPLAMVGDVAAVIDAVAPTAGLVVGMSLGGLTAIALAAQRPDLVARLALVDITPGVDAVKAKAIADFLSGPATFASFDELLARTVQFNPTRTESSLRRGILHNALQLDDGTWVWRHRRSGDPAFDEAPEQITTALWDMLGAIAAPVLLVRGMRPQSVVDDDDEAQLLRRARHGRVERFAEAGHSVQGDMPVELAATLARFLDEQARPG